MEATTGIEVKADHIGESKNMVKYKIAESGDREAVGTVYVSKECLESPYPTEITITIR